MASFKQAQEKVKVFEGGYSDEKRDRGNWICEKTGGWVKGKSPNYYCPAGGKIILVGTNHGISAPVLSTYLRRPATVSAMKGLSYSKAQSIYKKNYWDAIGGDKLKTQSISEILYDGAVNQGTGAMASIVSNSLKMKVGVPFSSTVISKINSANQAKLFKEIKDERARRYKKLGGYALSSWLDRLDAISSGATEFAKRNWIGITVSVVVIGFVAYYGYKNRQKVIKSIDKAL